MRLEDQGYYPVHTKLPHKCIEFRRGDIVVPNERYWQLFPPCVTSHLDGRPLIVRKIKFTPDVISDFDIQGNKSRRESRGHTQLVWVSCCRRHKQYSLSGMLLKRLR